MLIAVGLMAAIVTAAKDSPPAHPDYVPDAKTAKQIAQAVLIAQYGETRVKAQLPLSVTTAGDKDYWAVEGRLVDTQGHIQVGGAFGVWINKHDGCLQVVEHMK
jgi:hypothetical protein